MIHRIALTALILAALCIFTAAAAPAQGLIVEPNDEVPEQRRRVRNYGVSIERHAVDVTIRDQVATTEVTQVFRNPTAAMLEATYFFPLPEEAAIKQFSMTMNGQMVEGEVLEAGKARKIYEDIVRRMRDPGLLEYVGRKLFRARIFPVTPNGNTTVKITYSELLKADAGLVRYTYPLDTSKFTDLATKEVAVRVRLSNQTPIRSIYSPSHKVDVVRNGDNSATLGFELSQQKTLADFQLVYGLDTSDIGLSLLSYQAGEEPGTFMLLVTPKTEYTQEEIQPKDIIFIVDVSGSMQGRKMEQTQAALKYCLGALNEKDRFNIVPFSTSARTFRDGLVSASGESVKAAQGFVDELRAAGGTAIDEALTTGLGLIDDTAADRVPMVVFMTDGLPTFGETSIDAILKKAKAARSERVRLFTFGVGNDVNTRLLDDLAESSKGAREYIAPSEDIELKVGTFFDKVSYPVLTGLKLKIGGEVRVHDVLPRSLPDLFKGGQLVVTGRYEGSGMVPITLSGVVAGKPAEFRMEGKFVVGEDRDDFVPRLWAVRKVGYLMDAIRLNGANEELRKEIVRLGTRYGIVTPYTSFLVVEDTPQPTTRRDGRGPMPGRSPAENSGGRWAGDEEDSDADDGVPTRPAAEPAPAPPAADPAGPSTDSADREEEKESGAGAVERSRKADALRGADSPADALGGGGQAQGNGRLQRKTVGTRTFLLRRGWWIDTAFNTDKHPKDEWIEVETFSAKYFELLRAKPELAKFASVGDRLVVIHDGKAYVFKPAEPETEGAGESDEK
jgi:uncharacterized protein YegL/uncharacterized lipoprotein YajG